MHFGRSLLHSFPDKRIILAISLLITGIRMWIFYLIPRNPSSIYFLFAAETILRGPNLATITIASIDISSEVAGVRLQSSAQGIFWAGFMGISGVVASLVGGGLVGGGWGLEWVFGVAGGITSLAFLGMVGGIFWSWRRV